METESWKFTGTDTPNWDQEAVRIANLVACENFLCHGDRGVLLLPDGLAAVFGNDGYSFDPRARLEVHFLRRLLDAQQIDELGFGIDTMKKGPKSDELGVGIDTMKKGPKSDAGCSWAMIIRSQEESKVSTDVMDSHGDEVTEMVWQAWLEANAESFKTKVYKLSQQYPQVFGINALGGAIISDNR